MAIDNEARADLAKTTLNHLLIIGALPADQEDLIRWLDANGRTIYFWYYSPRTQFFRGSTAREADKKFLFETHQRNGHKDGKHFFTVGFSEKTVGTRNATVKRTAMFWWYCSWMDWVDYKQAMGLTGGFPLHMMN